MLDNTKPLVIVLSRNYSTGLGIIRSLGAAGYTVDLIASTKKKGSSIIASCSKYIRNSTEVLTTKIQGDSGNGLMKVLMEYAEAAEGEMVLFPTDDFTAFVVDSNRDILKEHFLMPYIAGESDFSIVEYMDKRKQSEIAQAIGLQTPREWIISLNNEIVVPKDMVYPCFVKPLQSISGQKMEMAVCNDENKLKKHLFDMKRDYSDRSVLVQEYLYIDKEYDLSGVCLDQKIIIPAIIEKTRIARHELGVTMSGRMVPIDVLGGAKDKIIEMLKQFHYMGMFDMELNLCGDKIYFNEVNFRSGGPSFSYYLNGVNLPAIFVREITGKGHNLEEEKIETFGKSFVYEKVAWEDYIHSYMTKQELEQCIEQADFTLLANEEDPGPGKCFYSRIRLSAVKHRVMMFLKKESPQNSVIQERNKVLVAGCNYCNILAMVRALGRKGYDIEVLRVHKTISSRINLLRGMKPEAYSKYVRKYYQCTVNEDSKKIVEYLTKVSDPAQKVLLIPTDDYLVSVVDNNLKRLSKQYIVPDIKNQTGGICRLMKKNEQKRLASEFGLPVLHSSLIQSDHGKFEIPDDICYPCFIKPNSSVMSTKAKMRKCANREELDRVLSGYAKAGDFEVLAEEFADIKSEYSILGLSTVNGTIAPGLFKVIEGGHRERKGVAMTGEVVQSLRFRPIINECVKFVESLHYTGLFDVDLIETHDGNIYFVELNFRAGASIHVFTESGVNLPVMFADDLLKGIPADKNCCVQETGRRFISEKILLEEYARSDVNIAEIKRCMEEADICFIKDEQDPQPYRYMRRFYVVAALLRIPYRVRDCRMGGPAKNR